MLAVQIAYKVKSVLCPCVYPPVNEIAEPLDVVDQPAKVYPVLVGGVGALAILPPTAVDAALTDVPPCESYVTVKNS